MARKASANSESPRGFYDIIGIVCMCFAALLLAALLSYHPRDVSANALPTNPSVHNWIGPFGAWMAYYCFLAIGAAAFVLPVLLFFVGLGCFFDSFGYLRRRWAWGLMLLICCMGLLDLYRDHLGKLEQNLGTTAGGILGRNLNQNFCGECFGTAGATIIFLMLYFISLLFLTNFHLVAPASTWRLRRSRALLRKGAPFVRRSRNPDLPASFPCGRTRRLPMPCD